MNSNTRTQSFSLRVLITLIITLVAVQVYSQEIIPMKKEISGIYTVPCEVNGLKLRFIFDTGASAVSISLTEATFMLKNGYLSEEDIVGTTHVQTADGNIAENYEINLNEIKVGSLILKNVKAVVSSSLDAPLLLGQSVLDELGNWSIKNNSLVLDDYKQQNQIRISDYETLNNYCEKLKLEGREKEALVLIANYKFWPDINSAMLFLSMWPMNDNVTTPSMDQCINYLANCSFDDVHQEFKCLSKVAWFYAYRLDDKMTSTQIYEKLARNPKYDKGYRWTAYHDLYILYYFSDKPKAIRYEKEAVDNGMYELAQSYSYYLIENNRSAEAFNLLQLGDKNGVWTSTYELGVGYIENKWPEKNISKGVSMLKKLMKEDNNDDAAGYLCSYYIDNSKYDRIFECLPYFTVLPLKNTFEGIAYFNKKDYSYACQKLEQGVDYGSSDILALRYCYLGEIYEKGLGGKLDFEKAFDNYEKLVKYDAAWGYEMLGDMFFLNELIQSDPERAYQYYVLGANNDSGYCCFRLALMNYYGVGTYKNEVKAQEYKAKAIKEGFKSSDFKF